MKDCLASPRNRRRRRPRRRRGAEIASGNCVFAEYHTAIHLDYDPATIAGTPIRDVLYTVFLRPKTGGEQKVFRFTGDRGFKGAVPEGDDPFPPGWPHLEVDPTREYCLRMSAQGFGDLARLAVESKEVCTTVQRIYTPGTVSDEPPAPDSGIGNPSSGPAASDGGVASSNGGPKRNDAGGCAVAREPAGPATLLLLVALVRLRRRQRGE